MSKAIAMIFFGVILASCGSSVQKAPAKKMKVVNDLEAIMQKDTLTVLTENGAISFYEYKDKYLGFEYEILDSIDYKKIIIKKILFESKHFDGTFTEGKKLDLIKQKLTMNNYDLKQIDKENILAERK